MPAYAIFSMMDAKSQELFPDNHNPFVSMYACLITDATLNAGCPTNHEPRSALRTC